MRNTITLRVQSVYGVHAHGQGETTGCTCAHKEKTTNCWVRANKKSNPHLLLVDASGMRARIDPERSIVSYIYISSPQTRRTPSVSVRPLVRCTQVVAKKSWLEVQRAPPVAGGLKHMHVPFLCVHAHCRELPSDRAVSSSFSMQSRYDRRVAHHGHSTLCPGESAGCMCLHLDFDPARGGDVTAPSRARPPEALTSHVPQLRPPPDSVT